jgi:DNA-binding LytR/AlgR family response regulator
MNNKDLVKVNDDIFKKSPDNMELFLKLGNRYEKLNLRQLLFIKADGKYIELHFEHGKRLMRISLVNFLKEPFHINLVRVHKSFAVNTAYITSYSSQEVTISTKKIPVGRRYKESLRGYLKHKTVICERK